MLNCIVADVKDFKLGEFVHITNGGDFVLL